MFRLTVITTLVALSVSFRSELESEWHKFKQTYGKVYNPREEMLRRSIWEDNVQFIQAHNLEADRGLHSYTLGVNEYSDMSHDEFVRVMNGYKQRQNHKKASTFLPPENVKLPDKVDWRTQGYVTPVKNQLQCGSCWAFSATGSLEGQHFKQTGNLVSLSEQNLIDCSRYLGNHGCEGGLMDLAFEYIEWNMGIDTESSYPYEGKDLKCRYKSANSGANDTGYVDIKKFSESDLQTAVATVGPISVAIDAGHPSFQHYRSGVYYESNCSSISLDHGVLAVGYGTDSGSDYWLVKNSWGTSWGQEGYIQMSRNRDNNCGIATLASYPLV